jgi:hypothetical protein
MADSTSLTARKPQSKPSLQPSEETIQKILQFSLSLKAYSSKDLGVFVQIQN